MIFGCAGAAYGTAKSGIGIAGVGTFRPDLIMKVSLESLVARRLTASKPEFFLLSEADFLSY